MGEIYFVRHGQASYGAADYDRLSPLGHQQSAWLGAHLATSAGGFDRVITGDLRRHRETLQSMGQGFGSRDVATDARLNEMAFFAMERAWQSQNEVAKPATDIQAAHQFGQIMAAWAADEIADAPETFAGFQTRVLAALGDHAARDGKVMLVSSGGPGGVIMRHVLGLSLAAMTDVILQTHNAAYCRYVVHPDRLRLLQFNAISHLEAPERQHAQTFL